MIPHQLPRKASTLHSTKMSGTYLDPIVIDDEKLDLDS